MCARDMNEMFHLISCAVFRLILFIELHICYQYLDNH